jgi:hypothetical protein
MTDADRGATGASAAADRVRFTAVVADLPTVQRLLMMVVSRRHALTRFEAAEGSDGRWLVTLDCPASGLDRHLLLERMRRLPAMLTVTVR